MSDPSDSELVNFLATLRKDQYKQLRKISYHDHVPMTVTIRTALDHYLDNVVNAKERDI